MARTLARSLAEQHPELRFVTLLVDEPEELFDPSGEPWETWLASELEIPCWEHMRFKYEITELNTAVKPYLLERLFDRHAADKLLYFDPDIVVYQRLERVLELLERQGAVLTPHILAPLEDDRSPGELDFLRVGSYNLGFLGLSRRGPWRELLRWWQSKVYRDCTRDLERGVFVDQHWMDLAPSLFEGVHILRDPGHNVAYWNLESRRLQKRPGGYAVGGTPLVFFHFSGFSFDDPECVSRHQNRFTLADLGDASRECYLDYKRRLEENGYRETRHWPYAYGSLPDGAPISDVLRVCLRAHDPDARRWPAPDRDGFVDWATAPGGEGGTTLLSPYALTLRELRGDLKHAFPRARAEDERDYATWLVQQRGTSPTFHPRYVDPVARALGTGTPLPAPTLRERLDAALRYYRAYPEAVAPFVPARAIEVVPEVYAGPEGPYGGVRRMLRGAGLLQATRRLLGMRRLLTIRHFFTLGRGDEIAPPTRAPAVGGPLAPAVAGPDHATRAGVNVIGFLDAETGVGEVARGVLRSLEAVGYPAAALSIRAFDTSRHGDASAGRFPQGAPHRINVFHVNADMAEPVARELGQDLYHRRYNVGYWFWELSRFPERWQPAFDIYDEIWVGSSFVQTAVAERAPIPVVRMPVAVAPRVDERVSRRDLGLPEQAFVVLLVFDALSIIERKNPGAAIRAFQSAFGQARSGDARLVVKVTNLERFPDAAAALRQDLRGVDGVLIDRYLDRGEVNALIRHCDAYLSLHRSEGLGLTLAEAMSMGKPVIATAYSGNADFMTPDNSYPVPYRLIPLSRDHPPYPAGYEWAEPDVEAAAAALRAVFQDPREARRRGALAADAIRREHSHEAVGRRLTARLALIEERLAR